MKKPIPFDFVLEELVDRNPRTHPMFGCTAVYVEDKIVFILRQKGTPPKDDGVWLATVGEHHQSLKKDFPNMRSIEIFGPGPTGWQVLPLDASGFEESVLKACEFVRKGDIRIGKVPKTRLRKSVKKISKQRVSKNSVKKTSKKISKKTKIASPKIFARKRN